MTLSKILSVMAVLAVAVLFACAGADAAFAIGEAANLAGASSAPLIAAAGVAATLTRGRKSGGGDGDAAPSLADLKKQLSEVVAEVKNFAEDVTKKMASGAALTEELKQKADEGLTTAQQLRDQMDEMEAKAANRARHGGEAAQKSVGQQFIECDEVKSFMASPNRQGVRMGFKTLSGLTPAAGGALVQPERLPGIVTPPVRRMTVRDLLAAGTTSSGSVEFVRETGFTNNADTKGETAASPESDLTFALENAKAVIISHHLNASRQILDDAGQLQSYIDGRMRTGLALKEERQLLNGDGTGVNMEGLVTQASAYSAPLTVAGASFIDLLRLAMLQAELAEYAASAIVLNPIDWAAIELTKDNEGRYMFANPSQMTSPGLWGKPVVATQAMEEDKFLTGAFADGAQVFDREEASVELSTEHSDNFTKGMVTVLAEERLALACYRPEAFVYGDLGRVE